jgi:hypothetical protein
MALNLEVMGSFFQLSVEIPNWCQDVFPVHMEQDSLSLEAIYSFLN